MMTVFFIVLIEHLPNLITSVVWEDEMPMNDGRVLEAHGSFEISTSLWFSHMLHIYFKTLDRATLCFVGAI